MKLSISIESTGNVILVDVPSSLTVEDFKAYLQAETDIEPRQQVLIHDGSSLQQPQETLDAAGIKENDLIVISLTQRSGSAGQASASRPSNDMMDAQIEGLRQRFLNDQATRSQIERTQPDLYRALNNPTEFKNLIISQIQQGGFGGMGGSGANSEEMRRLQENPDDPKNQERILELIRQEQIDENYNLAYETTPETFTHVNMLYINIMVNGHKVQAFVDSGAQSTIISPRLAEKVGIARLIDKRFVGQASGVGTQEIKGKIHSVPIRIGDSKVDIPASFIVLDTSVELLFGLDLLRRHKCVVDLSRDVLVVGGDIETKFLHESEVENGFGSAASGQTLGGGAPSGLGGNIFSDGGAVVPANSTPVGDSPASSAAAAATKRQRTEPNGSKFKEEDVSQLVGLGFSRTEAISALEATGGNVDMAASMLFQ